jgi:hypothetical protein
MGHQRKSVAATLLSGPEGKADLACAKVDIADLMSALEVRAEVAQRRSKVSF